MTSRPLSLGPEKLPEETRARILQLIQDNLESPDPERKEAWQSIAKDVSRNILILPLDEWDDPKASGSQGNAFLGICTEPFYKVFDMLEYVMRHPKCPTPFKAKLKILFQKERLAYDIETHSGFIWPIDPPTPPEEQNL